MTRHAQSVQRSVRILRDLLAGLNIQELAEIDKISWHTAKNRAMEATQDSEAMRAIGLPEIGGTSLGNYYDPPNRARAAFLAQCRQARAARGVTLNGPSGKPTA